MTIDPAHVRDVFLSAVEKSSALERSAYLDEACGGDHEFRRQVDILLRAHEQSGAFLDQGAFPTSPTLAKAASERPGDQIGPYKLLQQIGEGGMGAVYMAEQTQPVQRRVALKIIKPGMDSRRVVARFEAERQALAMMDHPNIAKVLDAGTTQSGRPYFVMELVKGVPITQYCDEQHLTPRERLELFLPVCQAVQHAHQKGIIHRDLKPSNILMALVDGRPVPKVIDFGVAKATHQRLTEKTMFTEYGQIVGTLEYMSPEQARLDQMDIDTRSDIYSLGVLLYELLTGATPFNRQRLRSAAFDELLRIIREEDPPRPSLRLSTIDTLPSVAANRRIEPRKLSVLLRGELDWIVMKALEKDRARRYETATGLMADLERYLHDEPVTACPPSAVYRFRKFARRHRAALLAGSLVAAALVAGTVFSTWQAVRATRAERLAQQRLVAEEAAHREADAARDTERQARSEAENQRVRAESALGDAEQARKRAEDNFAMARSAVDRYLNRVTEDELLRVPGMQPLRQGLLSAALEFYGRFAKEQGDSPGLRQLRASAEYRLGQIHSDLGDREAADAANQRAIEQYEALSRQGHAGPAVQLGLAHACFAAGRYDDAGRLCRALLQEDPKSSDARALLAETYNVLANRAGEEANDVESLRYHRQAFPLREELAREFPDNPAYQAQFGATLNNLGVLLGKQGNDTESLAMFQRGTEYKRRAYELAPHSIHWGSWLASGLANAARAQSRLGQTPEALKSLDEMVAVRHKLAFDNPQVSSLRAELSRAYQTLAAWYRDLNQRPEAVRSLRLARELLENMPKDTAQQRYELAEVYAELSRSAEDGTADEAFQAELRRNADLAVNMLRQAVEAGYRDASALETGVAFSALRQRDDFKHLLETVRKLVQAGTLMSEKHDADDSRLASREEALRLVQEVLADQPESASHLQTYAEALRSIGEAQTGLNQLADAEKSLADSIAVWRDLEKQDAGQTFGSQLGRITTQISLAEAYLAGDRGADGRRLYDECLGELAALSQSPGTSRSRAAVIENQQRRIFTAFGRRALWPLLAAHVKENANRGRFGLRQWDMQFACLLPLFGGEDELRTYCQTFEGHYSSGGERAWTWLETLWLTLAACLVDPPALPADALLERTRPLLEKFSHHGLVTGCALAQYRLGNYREALATLDSHPLNQDYSSLGGQGTKLMTAYLYALVAKRLGRDQQAIERLMTADQLWSNVWREALASEQALIGKPFEVVWWELGFVQILRREAWREVAGQAANESLVHLLQARAFHFLGAQDESERALAEAVKSAAVAEAGRSKDSAALAGGDVPLWALHGRILAEQGRPGEAEASFARAVTHPEGKRPPLAAVPLSSGDAAALQQAWAESLSLPVEFENSIGMKFRLVPPGSFRMGTPPEVRDRIVRQLRTEGWEEGFIKHHEQEGWVPVLLTGPYYVGVYEVTVGQFRKFAEEAGYQTDGERRKMGGFAYREGWKRHPSHIWKTPDSAWVLSDDQPVVHMTHNDAVAFCQWLSKKEGVAYSLPSEAEWEFACRAGSDSLYGIGDDSQVLEQIAWTKETLTAAGKSRAQPVGTRQPNAFGLYDMLGNAWEHCRDGYLPGRVGEIFLIDPESPVTPNSDYVARGGAWYRQGPVARCAHRAKIPINFPEDAGFGFRLAISSRLERIQTLAASPADRQKPVAPHGVAAAPQDSR